MRSGRLQVHIQQRYQHEQRAGEGVNEKFQRRPDTILPTPNGADKIDWDECQFVKNVKNQSIERHKYAVQGSQHQHD